MSLAFAAITPHPPLLLPSIGKDQAEDVAQTRDALTQLEQDLYIAKPQAIFVISPHTGRYEDSFCINANTHFLSSFDHFGDLTTSKEWSGTPDLAAKIAHASRESDLTVRLMSEEKLDHGTSIPLHSLTNHLPSVQILPIGYSKQDPKQHMAFGDLLKDVILDSDKRIAVIASGDLSHCHSTDGPGGFHKAAEQFDTTLIKLLETRNTMGVAQMDTQMVEDAQECAYRSTLILLGLLKNMDYTFKNYSYEAPHGVGYLVGNFTI